MSFIIVMASMEKHGIYEGRERGCHSSSRWHLWRNMASMGARTQMPFIVAMASMEKHGIYGITSAKQRLAHNRNRLDLDHDRRIGKSGRRDGGARRKVRTEDLGADLGHARGVARVDQKYRHSHDVAELRAGVGEGALDVAKCLPALGLEVAGKRLACIVNLPGVAGDLYGAGGAFGNDGGRERAALLPRAADE
jgi:hypothetical protein